MEARPGREEEGSGHHLGHLGHHLPPQQLDRFMSQHKAGGSESWRREEQEQRLDQEQDRRLGQDNRGFQLLERLGWEEGAGLGSSRQGITEPLAK